VISRRWSFKETRLLIKTESEKAVRAAIDAAMRARREIERYALLYPEFRYSLEPVSVRSSELPRIIALMLRAGEIAGVGPFASVAGAIAQVALEASRRTGASNVLIENGGDIALDGKREFSVGIFAGDSPLSGRIGFLMGPRDTPAGICTSAGTVGPSLNFGWADAVVVVADEASISDAAATSISNEVRGEDVENAIGIGLDRAKEIPEIRGCLIVFGGMVGTVGKLPRLTLVQGGEQKVFRPKMGLDYLDGWL